MQYPESIFNLFKYVVANKEEFLTCDDLHKTSLPNNLKRTEHKGKHPDVILYDGTKIDWKNTDTGSSIMFNSSIPTPDCYYAIRYKKRKFIIVNGSFFNREDPLSILLSSLTDTVGGVTLTAKNLTRIGKQTKHSNIKHRFRSMSSANCEIFTMAPNNNITILITTDQDSVNLDRHAMSKQIQVDEGIISTYPHVDDICLSYSL